MSEDTKIGYARKKVDDDKTGSGGLCFVRADQVEIQPVNWLWSNHLARGKITLLTGDTSLGKSTITIDLAARVTKVGVWPDGDKAPIGSVIILSSEDAINDTIVPRLEYARGDRSRVHCLKFATAPDGTRRTFSLQSDLAALGAKIQEIGDVLLIIIDPITSYLGS
jgi:hypothetical protein